MIKTKYIFIPLISLVALGGIVLAWLSIKNKKQKAPDDKDSENGGKGSGTGNGSGGSDTKEYTKEEASDKSYYADDTKMVLLMVYGVTADVYKDKSATQLLKTVKTVVGYTSLSEYEDAGLNDYISVYAYIGVDSNNNGIYKKGYVKKRDTTHSSYTTYDKLKKFLKLK